MTAQTLPADQRPTIPRLTGLFIAAGGAVVALSGIRAANGIVAPVLLALVIVVTVFPAATAVRARGWPGWAAMVLLMIVSYGIVTVLFGGTFLMLADLARLLPQYSAEFDALADQIIAWLANFGITDKVISDALASLSPASFAGVAKAALGSLGSVLAGLLLLLTVTYFLCLDATGFPARGALAGHNRPEVMSSLYEFARGTRLYLLVATIFGGIVALLDVALLYAMGIPDPWVWGLLAFLTGYIPNVGFVIGLIPVSLLALLEGGWTDMIIVIVAYCGINFVLQSLIQPKFVGDTVGLSTTVTFLSLAFWTFIVGPIGAILAVPLTLLARAVFISADPTKGWVDAFITSGAKASAMAAAVVGNVGEPSNAVPVDGEPVPVGTPAGKGEPGAAVPVDGEPGTGELGPRSEEPPS